MTTYSHAFAISLVTLAASQWPAPSSQPPTAPPAAEQPVSAADGGTVVTLTGCISPADPGAADSASGAAGFVLTDVTALGARTQATDPTSVTTATATSTSGTATRQEPAERYVLTARDSGLDLSTHARGRVKVTGTVTERAPAGAGARDDSRGAPTSSQPGGAGAQHALPTLIVHSIAAAEGACRS